MSSATANISISLDGFAAGPNQSPENPLGEGGERLHERALSTEGWRRQHGLEGGERGADSDVVEALGQARAYVMGRRMFGGGGGAWDDTWPG